MVVCKMRLRVKNALLHKLGFVQPPYFLYFLTCTPIIHSGATAHGVYRSTVERRLANIAIDNLSVGLRKLN